MHCIERRRTKEEFPVSELLRQYDRSINEMVWLHCLPMVEYGMLKGLELIKTVGLKDEDTSVVYMVVSVGNSFEIP